MADTDPIPVLNHTEELLTIQLVIPIVVDRLRSLLKTFAGFIHCSLLVLWPSNVRITIIMILVVKGSHDESCVPLVN